MKKDKLRIFLSSPHLSSEENELSNIKKAFENNQIFPFGNSVDLFEKKIELYLKEDKKVVATNSGTSAIHLALILSNVGFNDEVVIQSSTYVASAFPITYQGAKPIFIDSESSTWGMCPIQLERTIKDRIKKDKKPKAIIIVHSYGMPVKIEEIVAVSKKYDIVLIEDAAAALGSEYKGRKCGTFGDFGIFSFNGNKIITTSGGGTLVCNSTEEKEKAIFLATQARDYANHYQHSEIGYNYRMSNIVASIGCGQMDVLEKRIYSRRKNNQFYQDFFKIKSGVTVFKESSTNYFSNHWLTAIIINEQETGFSREDLRLRMLEDNIESRPLWKPMHLQPVFKDCLYFGGKVSEDLFKNGLCLPSGSNLSENDLERITNSINKCCKIAL